MTNRRTRISKGFSTVEMMIAMVIMIIAISAILLVCFGNQNFLVGSQTNSEALNKAQQLLEQEQAYARKDFRMTNSVATTSDGYYKMWAGVGASSNPSDYFTKQVTSYVSWMDDGKLTHNVQLATLVTNFENAIGGDTCNSFLSGNWKSPAVTSITLGSLLSDPTGAYPITDIDVYQKKLFVSVNQNSTVTAGPNTTANTASDSSVSGGVAWSNPNNAKTSDGSSSVSASSLSSAKVTDYLKLTGFGFAIPAWATITGIKVEIQKSRGSSGSGSVFDSQVKIVKNNVIGGSSGTNKADTATGWSSSNAYATYTTDLWGETWTAADINSANFGVAISATGSSGGSRTAQVDNVRITITYVRQFYVFDISNPTAPTFAGTLTSNPTITTGYNSLQSDGRFTYAATNSPTGQLQIIDASTTPYLLISTMKLGAAGASVGNTVFYKNGYVYLGLTNTSGGPAEFNIIDVHNPASPALIGSHSVGSAVNGIYVRGNTAYLTTSDTSKELLILDVSNPATPTLKSIYNATPDQSGFGYGRSEYFVGDNWYLGRTYIATASEFSYIDASGTAPVLMQTKDIGPNSTSPFSLNGIIVRDSLAFLLLGSGTKGGQLQIVNATSTAQYASPIALPNGTTGTGGVVLDCEGNYIYVASVDSGNIGYVTIVTAH